MSIHPVANISLFPLKEMAGPPDFILEQTQAMAMSPTTGRLEFIRRMVIEIKNSLAALRAHTDGQVRLTKD